MILFFGFIYLLYRFVYMPMQQKNAELKDALDRERMEKTAGANPKNNDFAEYEDIE